MPAEVRKDKRSLPLTWSGREVLQCFCLGSKKRKNKKKDEDKIRDGVPSGPLQLIMERARRELRLVLASEKLLMREFYLLPLAVGGRMGAARERERCFLGWEGGPHSCLYQPPNDTECP